MDSLSLLVVAIGSVLVTLVAYLGVIDYLHPVSDAKLSGIYPRRVPKSSQAKPLILTAKAVRHKSLGRHSRL
jgi:hypothetical protein